MSFPLVFRIVDDPESQIIRGVPDQQPVVPRINEAVTAQFDRYKESFRVASVEHQLGEEGRSSTVIIWLEPI